MRSRVTWGFVCGLSASIAAFACSDDEGRDDARSAGGSAGASTAGKGGSAGRGGGAGRAGGAGAGGRSSASGGAGQAGEAGAGARAGDATNAGDGGTAGDSEGGTAGEPSAEGGTAGRPTSGAGAAGESANGGEAGINGGGTSGGNGGSDGGAAGESGDCDPPLIVYLNRSGGSYTPGADDSRANKSSVIAQATTTAELAIDADDWDTLVSCFTQKFAPFNVQVVTAEPGNEAHIEVVFLGGGAESFLGSAWSLAPFTCSPVANAVVFAAGSVAMNSPQDACGASASAVGSALGLEAVTECPDAMAFSTSCPNAAFADEARSCGTSSPASCTCHPQSTTQNSYAYLASQLGFACH